MTCPPQCMCSADSKEGWSLEFADRVMAQAPANSWVRQQSAGQITDIANQQARWDSPALLNPLKVLQRTVLPLTC